MCENPPSGIYLFLGICKNTQLLDEEVFYTLKEASVLIEMWRKEYNTIRPHSALGYRPPAPEALWFLLPNFINLH